MLKHAFKTGITAGLTLLVYYLPIMPGKAHAVWAVVTSIIVMQANLGNTFKASGHRMVGTAFGALVGALGMTLLGPNFAALGVCVALVVLICSLLGLKDSFRVAGQTVALVMLLSPETSTSWRVAMERFLDISLGIAMALLTQTLIFPARAGPQLRAGLGRALQACGRLYQAVADASRQARPDPAIEALRTEARQLGLKNQDLFQDLQSEPGETRADGTTLPFLLGHTEALLDHILALDHAVQAMAEDSFHRKLEPQLVDLARATRLGLDWLATMAVAQQPGFAPDLAPALAAAEQEFARLREAGASHGYSAAEMVRFCAFFYSLRAVNREVRTMANGLQRTEPVARAGQVV